MGVDLFFQYARERHAIHLRRSSGAPGPWTEDPVLQAYRFCNVFRELDATTRWFRENVRDPLRDKPEVLLATVVFRLFNRITTGEAIFCQRDLVENGETAWGTFLKGAPHKKTLSTSALRYAILQYCEKGPYTTGSYMTKTPTGMNKLDGMLQVIEWFVKGTRRGNAQPTVGWREMSEELLRENYSLEQVWKWLGAFPFIGDFTAYEIVTDLRHTALLERAPDINTWANPGPGAKRGLNIYHGRPLKTHVKREVFIEEMMLLLEASRDPQYWYAHWPAWELRDVEHTLCEFFKYERARTTGQGTRQRFRGGM
jgi:hypothetical protein